MIVSIERGGKYEQIGMVKRAQKEMWFKSYLSVGNYLVYVLTPWKRNVNEFTFSTYGPEQIPIALNTKFRPSPDFVMEAVRQKALADPTEYKSILEIHYKYELSSSGFGYFHFQNRSQKQNYYIAVQPSGKLVNCMFSKLI